MDKKALRVIDANLNRLLEGLRVCEDIERFITADPQITSRLKMLRHQAAAAAKTAGFERQLLLACRDSRGDIGRPSIKSELKRNNYREIFYANIQRAKESIRVLEEFSKLDNRKAAGLFKDLRYKLYQIEKEAVLQGRPLRNN